MEWVSHGARYYNSEWGRFISPDPKREFYNQYSYCWDDPVNVIDRDGRGGSGIDAKVPVLTSWGNPTDEIFLLSDYGQAICAAKMAEYEEWKQQQLMNDEAEKDEETLEEKVARLEEQVDELTKKQENAKRDKIITYTTAACCSVFGYAISGGNPAGAGIGAAAGYFIVAPGIIEALNNPYPDGYMDPRGEGYLVR